MEGPEVPTEKLHEEIHHHAEQLEKDAQNHLRTHQALAASVTMFQIAIAVGAIGVLIRRRAFWLGWDTHLQCVSYAGGDARACSLDI